MTTLPLKPFYFIRHGETDWNKRNIIMGSIDIPLNDYGIEQARCAVMVLQKEAFDTIISSPRKRALKTAQVIAEQVQLQKPIIVDPGIVEREWGEAEGKLADPSKNLFDDADTPIGAETFSVFKVRIVEVVSLLLLKYDCPLIVSHGGVFKALADSLGYANIEASNCSPFFFRPPEQTKYPWQICNLAEISINTIGS